jgi:hypothetical protein
MIESFDLKLLILAIVTASLGAACKGKLIKEDTYWALRGAQIPGAPHDVDPIVVLPLAITQVEKHLDVKSPELLSIRMVGIASSGRMDLAGCDTSISYRFAVRKDNERTAAAATVGGGGMFTPVFEATSNIRNGGVAVPAPHCKVETVRAAAVAAGAADEPCALQLEYSRVADPEISWFHGIGWRTFGPAGPIIIDDATCAFVPR